MYTDIYKTRDGYASLTLDEYSYVFCPRERGRGTTSRPARREGHIMTSTRHYYAEECPYGTDTASDSDTCIIFGSRGARDAAVASAPDYIRPVTSRYVRAVYDTRVTPWETRFAGGIGEWQRKGRA